MKQPNDIMLAKYTIEKSDKALETGYKVLDIDMQTAQNRAYYAIFYIVLALGYIDGFKTGKHHQLMGWFNKKYIYQEKLFMPELSKIYSRVMLDRDNFDYIVTTKLNREEVLNNLEDAKKFIEKVKPYVLNRINQEEK